MPVFRTADSFWPNTLAIGYSVFAYALGLFGILADSWWLNIPGVLLLGHGMVIAAYLIHECAHNSLFRDVERNEHLGRALNWLTGGCYGSFEDLRHKHIRHHIDKADIVAFDYRPRLPDYPALLKFIQILEWLYIPALDLMMHALQIFLPFVDEHRRAQRRHVIVVLIIRAALFTALALYSLKVALLYVLAYFLMLHMLRFMDAFQHTYDLIESLDRERGEEARRFDRQYEHEHTYSNLISVQHPWLNLLVLNFCYHNAHHLKQGVPWFRLPALDKEAFGADATQRIPFRNQLWSYHRHRVPRVLNGHETDIGSGADKGRAFVGVYGVNFLTAF